MAEDRSGKYFDVMLRELIQRLSAIKDATDRQSIDHTASRLRLLNFDVGLDSNEKAFVEMEKRDVLKEVEKIERMTLDELIKVRGHEKDLKAFVRDNLGDEQAYLNRFKLNRIQLYLYNYTLLTRLRNDIDEAWDIVEELYGED